jgi:PAS domain S-box-containing protein
MFMEEKEIAEQELSEEIGHFTENYSSFNKIVNKLQRQYLTLKEIYGNQSAELQEVNCELQSLISKNQAVTEFLDSILDSLVSGVIAINKTGKVTHLNPAAKRILGLPGHNENSHYLDIIPDTDANAGSAWRTILENRTFENAEKRVHSRFGSILILSVSTSLLRNNEGEIIGAVELFHDMTRLRKIEEQLSRMKILASLGEMAASIAHEVRNPLGGIGGFAALLVRDLENDPPKRAMAEKIVAGVTNLNSTIETLLDFARHEEVHRTEVNLIEYLDTVLNDFTAELNGTLELGRIIRDYNKEESIFVDIDTQLFRQALVNLIKNGLEAGRDKGALIIRCHQLTLAKAQSDYGERMELSGLDGLAEIEIEDNGSGIPEEDIGRIFSPFYSTKRNGTGLGLSIAWKIVTAHGGDVRVISTVGTGTKFSVALPVKSGQS